MVCVEKEPLISVILAVLLAVRFGGLAGGEIEILILETMLWIRREHAAVKDIKAIMRDLFISQSDAQGDPLSGGGHVLPA
ncbi:hypothetical protein [Sphingomonas sp. GC_Shp_3]|uniref:hypothetical protein n=1 Tax=Sphingomonas sp. GC_Shp_3 TaxID=2937383 RepID=UPI00226A2B56|nr:hypothetical protein [Sphingomonas sp. GC_Shp_3]